jgi:hypothetical protein
MSKSDEKSLDRGVRDGAQHNDSGKAARVLRDGEFTM